MKIIKKKEKYKGKFLKIVDYDFLTKNGKKGTWETIKKKSYKRIVVIFAVTKKKELILEKTFRIPIKSFVIELPAGLTDKKGESETTAAKRELLEETGYLAKKVIPLFEWPLEPGSVSNMAILFFAPDVEYVGKKGSDDTEEIEVLKVSLKKLPKFLASSHKKVPVDIKIFGAFSIIKEKGLI